MSDPISTFVLVAGEEAIILTPGTDVPYDPSSLTDWAPAAPVQTTVRGVTETRKKVAEMDSAAVGGFTITASSLPTHLQPKKSRLLWAGTDYSIDSVQERRWRGSINGYTLLLKA